MSSSSFLGFLLFTTHTFADHAPQYGASDFPVGVAGGGDVDELLETVPGAPGEDYPVYSEVPETAFQCDGQVNPNIILYRKCQEKVKLSLLDIYWSMHSKILSIIIRN